MQHLIAPRQAGCRVAGMHAVGRDQYQRAGCQVMLPVGSPGEMAAASIHRTDGKRRVAVGLVAGPAVAGAPAFDMCQGRVAPQGGVGTGHYRLLGIVGRVTGAAHPYSFYRWLLLDRRARNAPK